MLAWDLWRLRPLDRLVDLVPGLRRMAAAEVANEYPESGAGGCDDRAVVSTDQGGQPEREDHHHPNHDGDDF
jgi:lysophospholipase L1-like esterase